MGTCHKNNGPGTQIQREPAGKSFLGGRERTKKVGKLSRTGLQKKIGFNHEHQDGHKRNQNFSHCTPIRYSLGEWFLN